MDLSPVITDNVTELLAKVIDFTECRHQFLIQNIIDVNAAGFVPKDLDVEEFADLMLLAISEHLRSERLLLCDSENIKFGPDGAFASSPIVDQEAKLLFEKDIRSYLELQIEKLSENLLNNRVATELLRQKQGYGPENW